MKLVCKKCEVEFRIEKSGITVAEMFLENEKIYKLWGADLHKCPKCGHEIVAGFALQPFAIHFKSNCESLVKKIKKDGGIVIYDYQTQFSHK